jgi:hypothetical protein
MERIKQIGIAVIASLLLFNAAVPPATWAQGAQPAKDEPNAGQQAAAGVTNVLFVPGKAIACTVTAGLWVVAMVLTLGGGYKDAANFVSDGCGGKWIVKGEDFSSSR